MATDGGEGQLKTWVSDRLMGLLGYSQGIVVRLVLRLAWECASAPDLAARLVDLAGFPSSPGTAAFAAAVYGRLPGRDPSAAGDSERQGQVQDAARKHSECKLLDEEASSVVETSCNSSDDGGKRFRNKKSVARDDNEGAAAVSENSARNVRRSRCPESEDRDAGEPDEDEEELRRRDQADRARLERNMRARDEASTRRLMDRKPPEREKDELARLGSEAMAGGDTSELRRASRRAYLEMRMKKKVEQLRDEIIDEELMFPAASGRRTPRRGR